MHEGIEGRLLAVYRKPGCPPCDEAVELLLEVAEARGMSVDVRNLLDDEAAWQRYRYLVPVVEWGGNPVLTFRFSRADIERTLDGVAPARRR